LKRNLAVVERAAARAGRQALDRARGPLVQDPNIVEVW
jgi:hypothetical protein